MFNAALIAALGERGNATIAEWSDIATEDGMLSDGIHPSDDGTLEFTDLVTDEIDNWRRGSTAAASRVSRSRRSSRTGGEVGRVGDGVVGRELDLGSREVVGEDAVDDPPRAVGVLLAVDESVVPRAGVRPRRSCPVTWPGSWSATHSNGSSTPSALR